MSGLTPKLVVGKHACEFDPQQWANILQGYLECNNYRALVGVYQLSVPSNSDLFVGVDVSDRADNLANLIKFAEEEIKDMEKASGLAGFHLKAVL